MSDETKLAPTVASNLIDGSGACPYYESQSWFFCGQRGRLIGLARPINLVKERSARSAKKILSVSTNSA
ncbi:MAG: hypothetical protein LBT86_04820 [Deltaproteobacteria bacterium]|nr:hypothetical protein [Deltaproteobacteria bacterium]